jgi:chromosome segregation ATPase
MIKNYNEFLEAYNVYQTDEPELANAKSVSNKVEKDVKEFLAKKTTLDNIYATYKDQKDLISKLFTQKFIADNTSDMKKIKFNNSLIGMYSMTADKKRKLKSLENDLQSQTDTLSNKKGVLGQNPDNKESMQGDIDYTQNKISDINTQINRLKTDIQTMETNTTKKLKEMKDNITKNKKQMDYLIRNK